MFGSKRDKVTESGENYIMRILMICTFHHIFFGDQIFKQKRMRLVGQIARMQESRVVRRVLVGKPEGKRPVGRPRFR
jgi:D-alanyl-lipoteichoic acid acyltransferase DltB (MBOAT superfamily)